MKIYQASRIMVVIMIMSMFLGLFSPNQFGIVSTAAAAEDTLPELLITEIVPNSSGSGELYEYVEIYNTTNQRIDLDGFHLQYFTSNCSNPANNWMISNKSIEAKSTLVLWLKKFANPNSPLSEFNENYNVDLTPEQVFEVNLTTSAQGLANNDRRRVGIADSNKNLISAAIINDGVSPTDGAAANKDKSVIYQYADDTDMERIANGQVATPGTLALSQVSGPQSPVNLTVEAGNQTVNLEWSSVGGSTYHIYYYSYPDRVVNIKTTEELSYNLEGLANNIEYVFWVTAVDAYGNESPATKLVKAMPMDPSDLHPPSVPADVKATPGTNRIILSWDESDETNLAGYHIYVEGTLYQTLVGTENQAGIGPLNKNQTYELTVSAYNYAGIESAPSPSVTAQPLDRLPELLITELVADTDNYASFDAFEFIELYNASDDVINLQGYQVISGWEKVIDRSIEVAPGEAVVLWTRRAEIEPISLEAFNSYYFTSYKSKYLSDDQVVIIHDVGGLVNGGAEVSIKDPDGFEISKASYTKEQAPLNKSANFAYPTDGSTAMRLSAAAEAMSPGSITMGQAPDKSNGNPPTTPNNVQAVAGYGTVTLTWSPNSEADVFKYNLYKNGILEHSISASRQEFIVHHLTGNAEYTFEMSAVDAAGNESAKSAPITATPAHHKITQAERDVNPYDAAYESLWTLSRQGPIIPGLEQDLIPQGLTYYEEKDWLLSVNYISDGRPSVLSVIDAKTDMLVKSVHLYQEDGTLYRGHAGGVAVSNDHVWVSSGKFVYRMSLDELIQANDNDEIRFTGRLAIDLTGSFATFHDGVLWVGEFYHPTANPTDASHHRTGRDGKAYHAWIEGFILDSETDLPLTDKWEGDIGIAAIPDYVLVITEKIQGVVFVDDSIILSQSYGRNVDSALYRYNSPLNEAEHETVTIGGQNVQLWYLDDLSLAEENGTLTIVPMSEGLTARDNYVYVMLESGANYYRYTTTYVMDRILKINLDQWARSGTEAAAPNISSIGLTPGSAVSTTNITGLQHNQSYKYVKGEAGSLVRPNIGDAPADYTSELTIGANIEVAIDDHIFVVELDGVGNIYGWADLHVTASDIKKAAAPGSGPIVLPVIETPDEKSENPGVSKLKPEEQHVVREIIKRIGSKLNAQLTILAEAFEYSLDLEGISSKVSIPVNPNEDTSDAPVGVYKVEDDGSLTYVGGKRIDNVMEVELSHSGTYVVLAYDKAYADVDVSHWAYESIRQLSAMQVIMGRGVAEFDPQYEITRAEYITMLVRALGLKASGNASFTDVHADDWFAQEMAAAEEAGLIAGLGGGIAAPNAVITREQMAILLVRAYELKTNRPVDREDTVAFNDHASVSRWAQGDLSAAYQLDLVNGYTNGSYLPQKTTTRAEAAKALYNLLTLSSQ